LWEMGLLITTGEKGTQEQKIGVTLMLKRFAEKKCLASGTVLEKKTKRLSGRR